MEKTLRDIMVKMCDFVGAKFDDIDFHGPDWFHKHSWTKEREQEFIVWIEGYLWENRKQAARELTKYLYTPNKKQVRQLAQEIVFMWGWKTVED